MNATQRECGCGRGERGGRTLYGESGREKMVERGDPAHCGDGADWRPWVPFRRHLRVAPIALGTQLLISREPVRVRTIKSISISETQEWLASGYRIKL